MNLLNELEDAMGLECVECLPGVAEAGRRLQTRPAHLVLAVMLAGSLLLLLTDCGNSLLLFLVSFAGPALGTLRSFGRQTAAEGRKWLLYWMIFGAVWATAPLLRPLLGGLPFSTLALTAAMGLLYCPAYDLTGQAHALLRPLWLGYHCALGELLALAEEHRPHAKAN